MEGNLFSKCALYICRTRKEGAVRWERTGINDKANYTTNYYRKHNCSATNNLHITEVY